MLRTRLLKFFGLLVAVFGILSAFLGVQFIRTQIIDRAENQVRSDLNSAWSVLNAEMHSVETTLRLTAGRPRLRDICLAGAYDDAAVRTQLESIRMEYGLDFISVLTPDSRVAMRSAPPYAVGDYQSSEPALTRALKGEVATGITLMTAQQLNFEHGNLADRAFLVREETPRARPSQRTTESRGMVLLSAVPVVERNTVLAVLYGGVLLNRNEGLVDRIHTSVFRSGTYDGTMTGSVTIFLQDCRVATTVRRGNGHRALGTLVSKEVADQVLDNADPWVGRAFVVRDWYLTAYDPIRNTAGEIIGMFYVGLLERPFTDTIRSMIVRYALLSLVALVVVLILAFVFASRVAQPLHALAAAANHMRRGEKPEAVHRGKCSTETRSLIDAFNSMAHELTEREKTLRETNEALTATNRSYMETLGFISHELKTPLGSILNYTFLLTEEKLGALGERQKAALRHIDTSAKRIAEMIRHYLNLSRIENDELQPTKTRIEVLKDVVAPTLDAYELPLAERHMHVVNTLPADLCIYADYNMTLEVFENMVSNAVKYGDVGGTLSIAAELVDGQVEFRVRNTGDGIAPEHLDSVFGKFARLNGIGAGKKKGTGLGLFITRHIVQAHGGDIRVQSRQGEWTEFKFTFPRCREKVANAN